MRSSRRIWNLLAFLAIIMVFLFAYYIPMFRHGARFALKNKDFQRISDEMNRDYQAIQPGSKGKHRLTVEK